MSAKNNKPQPAAKAVSKGTVMAAKYRARANQHTASEREAHRAHALSIIYGNPSPVVHAGSR
jgi:hypothetical protein